VKEAAGLKLNLKLLSSVLLAVALGFGAVAVPWALQPGEIVYKEPLREAFETVPEPVPAPLPAPAAPAQPPSPTLPLPTVLLLPLLGCLTGFVAAFVARKRLKPHPS